MNSWITNSQNSSIYKSDGIRVVASGASGQTSGSLLMLNSIIGPGLSTGINVQSPANLKLQDCLLINASLTNLSRASASPSSKLDLFRVTSFMTAHNPYGQFHAALQFNANQNDSIRNSIFSGGIIQITATKPLGPNNVQSNTLGNTSVLSNSFTDPKCSTNLVAVPDNASVNSLAALDFSLTSGSPKVPYGLGSLVTSVKQLLSGGN
jgi:hypothetical protein